MREGPSTRFQIDGFIYETRNESLLRPFPPSSPPQMGNIELQGGCQTKTGMLGTERPVAPLQDSRSRKQKNGAGENNERFGDERPEEERNETKAGKNNVSIRDRKADRPSAVLLGVNSYQRQLGSVKNAAPIFIS